MNYKTVKRPDKRYKVRYDSSLKIQLYGEDNLYPQRMLDLIANSPTGGTCIERYRTFIEGNGLMSEDLAYMVCNRLGDTVDDVFKSIVNDVANHAGFALHVCYNLQGKITEIQHVPFSACRIDEEDDAGRIPFISVHPDWEGNKTRRGKTITVNVKNVRKFYPFAPIPDVVLAQMAADGGIDQYRGQILWVSFAGRNTYPKSIFDKIITELSVDEGLSNVKYRNVRNNFLLSGMVVHKKGTRVALDEDGNEVLTEDEDGFTDSLEEFQGDVNACTLMDVTYNSEEDIPKFINVEGTNFDKKFETTETSTTERIYSAFGQEPWYCIRVGKVGFSGDILREAYEYYNSYVQNERRTISRSLQRLFKYWYKPFEPKEGFEIEPLVYQYNYSNGNLDNTQKENGENGANNNTRSSEDAGQTNRTS